MRKKSDLLVLVMIAVIIMGGVHLMKHKQFDEGEELNGLSTAAGP